MVDVEAISALKMGNLSEAQELGVTERTINVSSSDAMHKEFLSKMQDVAPEHFVSIGPTSGAQGNALSDHLFSAYQGARETHNESLHKVSTIFEKEDITIDDIFKVRQELDAMKYRGALAIKGVEKTMETFNQLLKMQ